jgi:regulatory protein
MAADEGKALVLAYRYINSRERTVAEVRSRLERAELSEAEITGAIEELVGFGYVDDARYARVFAEDKRTLEAWGNERIERALFERGVDRAMIEEALVEAGAADGVSAREQELERAMELLARRFPMGAAEPRDRERAFGVLVRKGYDSELAGDAVRAWARAARP